MIKGVVNFLKKHCSLVLTIMFSLILICMFIPLSLHDNIWYDEAYQMVLNENNLFDIIKFVARDFHGPFYAVGLKIITSIFGSTAFVGRMFSLSAIICCFILCFYKIKDLYNIKTSIMFAIFLLSLSCFYFCTIEIRPYSWPMFLTLTASVYMISIIKNNDKKSWIMYVLFSVLSMYSHNIALIFIFCNNLVLGVYLLINNRKSLFKYFIASLIRLTCYLPWVFVLVKQYKNLKSGFWIESPNLIRLLNDCKLLISNNEYIVYLLVILFLVSVIYVILKYVKRKYSYILLISVIFAFMFCYLFSKYVTPIIYYKYFVTFIGVAVLVMADFISSIKSKAWSIVIILLLIFNSYVNYKYELQLTKDDNVRELKEYFNKEEIYFVHYYEFSLGVFRYYFPNATHVFTDEIESNLKDYELFGDNVIELDSIEDLDVNKVYTVGLNNGHSYVSEKYFNRWEVIDNYFFNNNYENKYYFIKYLKR